MGDHFPLIYQVNSKSKFNNNNISYTNLIINQIISSRINIKTANLSVDMIEASVKGSTTLWMAFKESDSVKSVDSIYLHCRKCKIIKVCVGFVECMNDVLKKTYFMKSYPHSFLGRSQWY